jgi:hypothetical protein
MQPERLFWPLVAMITVAAGAIEIRTALGETQTWDEGIHISAGYQYLTRGDFTWNVEHPPLVKMIAALPLTMMGLTASTIGADGKPKSQIDLGIDFLYRNRRPVDTILFVARCPNILLTLLFTPALAWWVRRRWGPAAGLLAAALCAFDPNLIAHGRYVTTDYPVTVFFFFTCVLWTEYLESGGGRRLLAAAAAFAIAMIVKFSAILLVPPVVILYAVCWIRRPAGFRLLRAAGALTALAGATAAAVMLIYWPDTVRCLGGGVPLLFQVAKRENAVGEMLYLAGRALHLPAHAWFYGLNAVAEHNSGGHESYLLGMRSTSGWWYYFPVVFGVKSTLTAMAATLVVAVGGAWVLVRRGWSAVTPMALGLAVPPVLYFLFSMSSGINIGMRHILPIYPFLYTGAAAMLSGWLAGRWRRAAAVAMLALAAGQIAECASIYPDYLAFFNAAVGGPGRGPEYLLDSNIDWGQDGKKLSRWLRDHGTNHARIFGFGNTQLAYYGVREDGWPLPLDQAGWDAIDDYCAVNVTPFHGVYVPLNLLTPLRMREPVAKVGWSIYIYDLRKPKPPR